MLITQEPMITAIKCHADQPTSEAVWSGLSPFTHEFDLDAERCELNGGKKPEDEPLKLTREWALVAWNDEPDDETQRLRVVFRHDLGVETRGGGQPITIEFKFGTGAPDLDVSHVIAILRQCHIKSVRIQANQHGVFSEEVKQLTNGRFSHLIVIDDLVERLPTIPEKPIPGDLVFVKG